MATNSCIVTITDIIPTSSDFMYQKIYHNIDILSLEKDICSCKYYDFVNQAILDFKDQYFNDNKFITQLKGFYSFDKSSFVNLLMIHDTSDVSRVLKVSILPYAEI